MKKVAIILMALFFLGGLPTYNLRQSHAQGIWDGNSDFYDNFNQYPGFCTIINPYPFTFLGSGGGTGCVLATSFNGSALPNVYHFSGGSASSGKLYGSLNATGTLLKVTGTTSCVPSGTNFTIKIQAPSFPSSQTTLSSSCGVPTDYQTFTVASGTIPGSTVQLNFTWVNASGGGSNFFLYLFNATYGAVQIPSYNFALYNSSSAGPYWFDIADYPGSQLVLNYSSSASNSSAQWQYAFPRGLQYPDVKYANLNTAKLITLYVGGIYSRTLIPAPETALKMYVDNPASVQAFKVQVLAPPGYYTAGSDIFIQSGGHNITSGYLDSVSSFSTYLVPGLYTVIINDGTHIQSQLVTFSSTTSLVQIDAYNSNVPNNANGISSTRWIAGYSSSGSTIVVKYWDNLSSTYTLGVRINLQNGSGNFLVYSNKFSVGLGTSFFSTAISSATLPLNTTNAAYLYVVVTINSTYFGGNYSLGTQPLASCSGCILPQTPTLSTNIGGLSNAFPNVSWQSIFADLIVLFVGGSFGLFQSKFGAIITPIVAGFLALAGFLAASLEGVILALLAFGILSALSWFRRQP